MNIEFINNLPLKDKRITCIDCGNSFIFKAEEQKYFLSKGLSEPKRCKPCRLKKADSCSRLASATKIRQPISSEQTAG